MARSRMGVAAWTVALTLTTSFIVGAVIRTPAGISDVQLSAGVVVTSGPVLAVLLSRRWNQWSGIGSLGALGVYFATLFICCVVLLTPVELLAGEYDYLTLGLELLGAGLAFAATSWVCFYGGFWDVLRWAERHFVPDGRSRNA